MTLSCTVKNEVSKSKSNSGIADFHSTPGQHTPEGSPQAYPHPATNACYQLSQAQNLSLKPVIQNGVTSLAVVCCLPLCLSHVHTLTHPVPASISGAVYDLSRCQPLQETKGRLTMVRESKIAAFCGGGAF